MEILKYIKLERDRIEACIKRYGYTADHNFDWLMNCADEGKPTVAVWDDGYAIWCYDNGDEWILMSDPIAPKEKHRELLKELVEYIFKSGVEKIYFLDVQDEVMNICRNLGIGNYEFYYDIVWPVMAMEKYDVALPGGHFKSIRNAKNKFYREHEVKVVPSSEIDKKILHEVIDRWYENRTNAGIEDLYPIRFHNLVDDNFKCAKSPRVMVIDGKVVGFNAGWETPNIIGGWSAAVGIHGYSVKELGLILMLEYIDWIKNAGYKLCDLEGSDPEPLKFKMQFNPTIFYKTYTFWLKK